MALIAWSDALSVHVEEIDNQHKVLVNYINELNDAMKVGKGKDALNALILNLIKYTHEHFATEEKYFTQFKYPNAFVHIQEHRKFVEKVAEFKKEFDLGSMGLTIPVMDFLSNWLTHHIQGSDMKYSACFNENGLK